MSNRAYQALSRAAADVVGSVWAGSRRRRRPERPVAQVCLEMLETRQMLSALYWDASADGGLQPGPGTWSDSDVSWNTQADGNGTRTAWIPGSDAVFSAGGASAITVSGAPSVNSLTFSGTGYAVSGGTLTLGGTGAVVASADATVASVVTGTAGLTKSGSGTLILSGSNTYTGNTTAQFGMLALNRSADSYAGSVDVYGTLRIDGGNFTGGIGNSGTLAIVGGTIGCAVSNSYGSVAIHGGIITGAVTGYYVAILVDGGDVQGMLGGYGASVQISGGTVSGDITNYNGTVTFADSLDRT